MRSEGIRRRAEIDVEYDVPDTGDFQPPQQVGVEAAWPWPDTDFLDRWASIAITTTSPVA